MQLNVNLFINLEWQLYILKINLLFDIYLAIQVSSSSAERSFSTLKRTKTWIRNTMGEARLSNRAILNIEQGLVAANDIDAVVKIFASLKDRRCEF